MLLKLLLLVSALHAAQLKVVSTGDRLLVYVDGKLKGKTPIIVTVGDGRHKLMFKKAEYMAANITQVISVDQVTKGKLTVDWGAEKLDLVWAEDIIRAREAERAALAAAKQAEEDARLAAIEAERQAREEEARLKAEAKQREREAKEAAARAEEEAAEAARQAELSALREKGHAYVKAKDLHRAVAAYRVAKKAGDDDPRFLKLLKAIEQRLCSVRLTVQGIDSQHPPTILLAPPEGEPFPPDKSYRNSFIFRDVPAEQALVIRIGDPGYQRLELAVEPVERKAKERVSASLTWLGLGELLVSDWTEGVEVIIEDADQQHTPTEGGALQVTAGRQQILLSGPTGSHRFELEVAESESVALQVKPNLPGIVELTGLPAGSSLELLDGPEGSVLAQESVPREDPAEVDQGVPIASNLVLKGLLPGDHGVQVSHPNLGSHQLVLEPRPGERSEQSFSWEDMSAATAVKQARQDWEQRLAQSKLTPKATKLAWISTAASAAVLGATGFLTSRVIANKNDLDATTSAYNTALADQNAEDAWSLFAQKDEGRRSLRKVGIFAGASGAVGIAGATVSFVLFRRGKADRVQVEPWDFFSLPLVGAQTAKPAEPAAEEAAEPEAAEDQATSGQGESSPVETQAE